MSACKRHLHITIKYVDCVMYNLYYFSQFKKAHWKMWMQHLVNNFNYSSKAKRNIENDISLNIWISLVLRMKSEKRANV